MKKVELTEAAAATTETVKIQDKCKDSVFRMLFHNKENLLSLYNALNKTAHTDIDSLEITTLENAVYMNYKNDVSFVLDDRLMLYEHQSTVNPNMPLRDLIYITKLLQGRTRRDDIYSSALIKIPAPRFVVFYNGTHNQPEKQILRLSDAFERNDGEAELELKVTVYNVNWGCNLELMEACEVLKEYAQFVEQVRTFEKDSESISEAVEKAVDYCIKNDILSDFLLKNRAEAIEVCIYEYDEEKHIRNEKEISRKEGLKEGEERFEKLLKILNEAGRTEDVLCVINDREYRAQLYQEYNMNIPE